MEKNNKKVAMISVSVYNRDVNYSKVNDILHNFGEFINLRVGYPMKEKNVSIIFLVVEAENDIIGALNGKLGQIDGVLVKSHIIKMAEE